MSVILLKGKGKNITRRFCANLIDYLVYFILTFFYLFLAGAPDGNGGYHVEGLKALVPPIFWFLYFPSCESLFGQTLAKHSLHLYVVDLRGERISIGHAFLRRMFDPLELAFWAIPAVLMINQSEKNQRLGDMAAGTTVVRVDVTCRHCQADLELTPQEVIRNAFVCPNCMQAN